MKKVLHIGRRSRLIKEAVFRSFAKLSSIIFSHLPYLSFVGKVRETEAIERLLFIDFNFLPLW
jgi:hypothetical protein